MSERMYVGEFAAAVGIDTAANYKLLSDRLSNIARPIGSLALGVLMSEKTGLLGISNRHGAVYPLFDEVVGMAQAQEAATNPLDLIVHYNTDNPDQVGGQLVRALGPIASNVNAVQVNGLEFDHLDDLNKLKAAYPHIAVIMQIHSELLRSYHPGELAALVDAYKMIDGVWIDDSGGVGRTLDPAEAIRYVAPLYEDSDVLVGLGGGLTPDTLRELLPPILNRYPAVCWDGQSGVQITLPGGSKQLDADKAATFLEVSAELRRAYPVPE